MNYVYDCSFILDTWLGKESERLNEIAKIVNEYSANGNAVICLQECPGQLLDLLMNLSSRGMYSVYHYTYSRNPKLKNKSAINPYPEEKCTECLITLIGKNLTLNNTRVVQFEDRGKASLIADITIEEKNISIANIHCPFGDPRNGALEMLKMELGTTSFVILGDFNTEQSVLETTFDTGLHIFSGITETTRIAKHPEKTVEEVLDHMIGTTDITFGYVTIEPNNNLSDHLLIGTTVTL